MMNPWNLPKSILFRIDAEEAHKFALAMIHLGIHLGNIPNRLAAGTFLAPPPPENAQVLGMKFRSRVGLAAGFDKDAEILAALPALGFGFAEIGTVTPRPQPGNDRPRLFRDPDRQALFNRMGFNNLGASVVSARLAHARPKLPEDFRVGVNLGKNKDTALEDSARDYADAVTPFDGLADYLVINVSSPNTPGLRSLQTLEALKPIVGAVNERISRWSHRPPLLLKLAPEVTPEEFTELVEPLEKTGVNGWILTNTLGGTRQIARATLPGGQSGAPLTSLARDRLASARALTRLPIISVGGIMDPDEAKRRLELGAELIQLYSGWIYGGPRFPAQVARALRSS